MITKEKLALAGADRLAEIIISLYENNKDIQKQLNTIVAGLDDDPKKLISALKKEIAGLKRSTKFIDYYESTKFADNLDHLRQRISEDLMLKSASDAATLMLSFLDLHKNTLNRVDDSNGEVGGVFRDACENLGQIYAQLEKPIEEIVDLVFNSFVKNNEYAIYDDIIFNFKESLQSQGLLLLKDRIEKTLNLKNTITVQIGLCQIADCRSDPDSYIEACKFASKLSAYNHLEIAKRLIKAWRSKEALEWLDKADIALTHPWYDDLTELRIEALEIDGNYVQVQKERVEWFNRSLSSKVYGQILSHVKPEFKDAFKKDAIKKAFSYEEPHAALAFLIQAQEFDEAIKLTRLKLDQLDGGQYRLLRQAADIFSKIDALTATLLYREMLEAVVAATRSKYYNYAAKDLVSCDNLSTEITNWEIYENHQAYLEQFKVKHKRKVSFWGEYDIALQKQAQKEAKRAKAKE